MARGGDAAAPRLRWFGQNGSEGSRGVSLPRSGFGRLFVRNRVGADDRLGVVRVWVSEPWRDQLEDAIGPVMAWVIPICLAYVPGLMIGFMVSTLLLTRYREVPLTPPEGVWWPGVTVLIAARNEERAIASTLERIGDLDDAGPVEVVLADNGSTDRTAAIAEETAQRLGIEYRHILEPQAGKHHALNAALATVRHRGRDRMPTPTCNARR